LLSLVAVAAALAKVQGRVAVVVRVVFLLPLHLLCHLAQPTQSRLVLVVQAQLT
jgi:hypothetical protein